MMVGLLLFRSPRVPFNAPPLLQPNQLALLWLFLFFYTAANVQYVVDPVHLHPV